MFDKDRYMRAGFGPPLIEIDIEDAYYDRNYDMMSDPRLSRMFSSSGVLYRMIILNVENGGVFMTGVSKEDLNRYGFDGLLESKGVWKYIGMYDKGTEKLRHVKISHGESWRYDIVLTVGIEEE